jgi:ABC-2 type transport system permease protein
MNIYFRELKANRKALIIWCLAMMAFVIMEMQEYTSMINADGSTEVFELFDKMPKFLQAMWGMSALDLTTPIGYFGVLLPYLVLLGTIYSSMLGNNLIYKEERDKTADFLMTKPVSRYQIMTSKLLAGLTNIFIFDLVTIVTAIFVLDNLDAGNITTELLLSFGALFLTQLLFIVIGAFVTIFSKNLKKAAPKTLFILIISYFIAIIVDLSDKLKFLKVFTPFKYFDAKDFLKVNHYEIIYVIITLVLVASLLVFGYKKYTRKDLAV